MLRSPRRIALVGIIGVVACFVSPQLLAQDAGIVYAEGGDFSIIRGREQQAFNVVADNILGLPLQAGDLVQTGDTTFLEIAMQQTGAVFKVAENTSFRLEYAGPSGSSRLDLAYGRVRAKAESVAAGTFLEMRGLSVVAGVRGTDFGYDIIVTCRGTGEPVLQIYTFEGTVVVAEGSLDGVGDASLITEASAQTTIESGQMITIPLSTVVAGNVTEALAQPPSTISPEIRDFWDAHPFRSLRQEPPQIAEIPPQTAPVMPPAPEPLPPAEEDEEPAIEPLTPLPPFVFAAPPAVIAETVEEPVEAPQEAPEEEPAEARSGEGWKQAGLGMSVLGAAVAITGVAMYFALDLVDVPASYEPSISPGIALMIGGGGLIVGGFASYITGSVIGGR